MTDSTDTTNHKAPADLAVGVDAIVMPRRFQDKRGFLDGTGYLECLPDGSTICVKTDGSQISGFETAYPLSECLRLVEIGYWVELRS